MNFRNHLKNERKLKGVAGLFLTVTASFLSVVFVFYPVVEPIVTSAVTDDVLVSLSVTSEITISSPSDVTLTSIPGMTGGSSTSSAIAWTVITNDTSGYSLTLKKGGLMSTGGGGASKEIADYTEAVSGTPDYSWGSVGAGNEEFGFAPSSGSDFVQKFKNSGSSCNQAAGTITDGYCWLDIPTTPTTESIASSSSTTGGSGSETAIKVKTEVGSSNYLEEGTYTTTLTATAVTN